MTSWRLLNRGCGQRLHPDWVNVDVYASAPSVIVHDLRRQLPFESNTFDVVYHSHVLEHFRRSEAPHFLAECRRVLRPGGGNRIAVPDLEQIARLYLEMLERARVGDEAGRNNYEWMMIELFDQTVRDHSGGGHGQYFDRDVVPNIDFVVKRQGVEVERALALRSARRERSTDSLENSQPSGSIHKRARRMARRLIDKMDSTRKKPLREHLIRVLLGSEYELLGLGRFKRSGELHYWMYDSYSLSFALSSAGFTAPRRVGATESRIPNWVSFNLDTEPSGRVYKPDSLFMEGIKE